MLDWRHIIREKIKSLHLQSTTHVHLQIRLIMPMNSRVSHRRHRSVYDSDEIMSAWMFSWWVRKSENIFTYLLISQYASTDWKKKRCSLLRHDNFRRISQKNKPCRSLEEKQVKSSRWNRKREKTSFLVLLLTFAKRPKQSRKKRKKRGESRLRFWVNTTLVIRKKNLFDDYEIFNHHQWMIKPMWIMFD